MMYKNKRGRYGTKKETRNHVFCQQRKKEAYAYATAGNSVSV